MTSPGTWFASSAFNVVDWSCAAGNLSLAHELGHNEGMHHYPANASGQGVVTPLGTATRTRRATSAR